MINWRSHFVMFSVVVLATGLLHLSYARPAKSDKSGKTGKQKMIFVGQRTDEEHHGSSIKYLESGNSSVCFQRTNITGKGNPLYTEQVVQHVVIEDCCDHVCHEVWRTSFLGYVPPEEWAKGESELKIMKMIPISDSSASTADPIVPMDGY